MANKNDVKGIVDSIDNLKPIDINLYRSYRLTVLEYIQKEYPDIYFDILSTQTASDHKTPELLALAFLAGLDLAILLKPLCDFKNYYWLYENLFNIPEKQLKDKQGGENNKQ